MANTISSRLQLKWKLRALPENVKLIWTQIEKFILAPVALPGFNGSGDPGTIEIMLPSNADTRSSWGSMRLCVHPYHNRKQNFCNQQTRGKLFNTSTEADNGFLQTFQNSEPLSAGFNVSPFILNASSSPIPRIKASARLKFQRNSFRGVGFKRNQSQFSET